MRWQYPGVEIKPALQSTREHVSEFGDPRTGLVTFIAVTQGEETFIDSNGNGLSTVLRNSILQTLRLIPRAVYRSCESLQWATIPAPCPANPLIPLALRQCIFDPTNRFELL
jgi:hypothetical protein